MKNIFPCEVILTNDANAAALGEKKYGAAKDMDDFIMITLGTGLGSGIFSGGKLIYGHDGLAGEMGHITIDINGRECNCGKYGCLESYVSATGIRKTINEIGYDKDVYGFNANNCEIINHISQQSPDIAQGVNEGEGEDLGQGAGDQGLMFGYACKETDSLMPAPIDLSHKLVMQHARLRKTKELEWLRPDAKSQVSLIYSDDGKNIEGVSAIVLSTQHDPDISQED